MGWLAFTLCKWFVGGTRCEECKESKWVILTKHWGTPKFATRQVIMVATRASVKNMLKIKCGGHVQQEAHVVRWAYPKQG